MGQIVRRGMRSLAGQIRLRGGVNITTLLWIAFGSLVVLGIVIWYKAGGGQQAVSSLLTQIQSNISG